MAATPIAGAMTIHSNAPATRFFCRVGQGLDWLLRCGPGRKNRGRVVIHYTIPTPEDSPTEVADAAEFARNGRAMSTVRSGGPDLTVGSTVFELCLVL